MNRFFLSPTGLDPALLKKSLQQEPQAGAFASFEGWVRDHNEGRSVTALDYEIFDTLAVAEGNAILADAIERFDLLDAKAVHRSGALEIGDCALWIGVTARHRGEAFDACRAIVNDIKHRLPVWKKEHYATGESRWVNGQQSDDQHHDAPPHPAFTANHALKHENFYDRQILLPEIGALGQRKLCAAKVLIVGVGGLGSSAALALAAAGVGTLGLVEPDKLELTNLNRQILYAAEDIGSNKVDLALQRLAALNPFIKIVPHQTRLTAANAETLLENYDLVLDCTDNFKAKYLLNDAAILFGKTVIQASIYRFEGHLLKIDGQTRQAPRGGCLRCLWPEPPMAGLVGDCVTVGVLGTVPMIFGTLQANEAIKHILDLDNSISENMMTFDLMRLSSQILKRHRREDCALCGKNPTLKTLTQETTMPYEISPQPADSIITLGLRFRLLDVREDHECIRRPIVSDYHYPFSSFNPAELDLPSHTKMLVVCEKGSSSLAIATKLRQEGWSNIYSLHGGLDALQSAEPLDHLLPDTYLEDIGNDRDNDRDQAQGSRAA